MGGGGVEIQMEGAALLMLRVRMQQGVNQTIISEVHEVFIRIWTFGVNFTVKQQRFSLSLVFSHRSHLWSEVFFILGWDLKQTETLKQKLEEEVHPSASFTGLQCKSSAERQLQDSGNSAGSQPHIYLGSGMWASHPAASQPETWMHTGRSGRGYSESRSGAVLPHSSGTGPAPLWGGA